MSEKPADYDVATAAKSALRQGMDVTEAWEAVEIAETPQERARAEAFAAAMEKLVTDGYQPEPMPPLGIPTRQGDGNLRFMARDAAMMARAKAALQSQAVQNWHFFNGEEDETVAGRVIEYEPVHALAMFTVKPVEE